MALLQIKPNVYYRQHMIECTLLCFLKINVLFTLADQQDEQAIMTLAIENFNRTSMFPGTPTEAVVDPNTVRPEMIDIVKNDKNLSAMVATTHEFRRNMRKLPQAMRARIDQELNQVFGNRLNLECRPIFVSLEEEQIISYERIKLLVSDRMRPYFEHGQINKSSDFEILVQLISRTLMESASDPSTILYYFIVTRQKRFDDFQYHMFKNIYNHRRRYTVKKVLILSQ
jgi:hypothetical protein